MSIKSRALVTFWVVLLIGITIFSCTKRQPEEIDYAPNTPYNPYPPDSATNIDHTTTDVTLRWTATDPNSDDVLTYDVFFDTLNPPENKIASGLKNPYFFIPGLSYHTTYYWRLYISDDAGVTAAGPVWCFTTLPHPNQAPSVPVYLSPGPDSTGTYPTLDLHWSSNDPDGSSDTVEYKIHLGISNPPNLYSYTFFQNFEACCLNYSTVYFWKIVATDNHGAVSSGPVVKFTTRASPWYLKAPMPLARRGFASTVYDNKIYVIGGKDESGMVTGTMQIYDPLADAWSIRASMPTARHALGAAAAGGKIYAVGGKNASDSILGTTEEYDPASDTWTTKRSMIIPRWSPAVHTINGLVYAVGGYYKTTSLAVYMQVEYYNPLTNLWTKPRSITRPPTFAPLARLYTASGVLDERIIIAGGYSPFYNIFSTTVNVYDPATKGWSLAAPLPQPRSNGAGVVANGCFYLIGGYDGRYLRKVYRYDPLSDLWAQRGDMLNSRSGCGGGLVNGNIYIVGGFNEGNVGVTEEYRLSEDP